MMTHGRLAMIVRVAHPSPSPSHRMITGRPTRIMISHGDSDDLRVSEWCSTVTDRGHRDGGRLPSSAPPQPTPHHLATLSEQHMLRVRLCGGRSERPDLVRGCHGAAEATRAEAAAVAVAVAAAVTVA